MVVIKYVVIKKSLSTSVTLFRAIVLIERNSLKVFQKVLLSIASFSLILH